MQKLYEDAINEDRGYVPIGFDWIKSGDNLILLEMNVNPGFTDHKNFGSRLSYFAIFSYFKTNQHRIFGDLMPEYCDDEEKFNDFIKKHDGKVVYKSDMGTMGDGVSILKAPEWVPDMIEEFIEGDTHKKHNGKEYPYVFRNVIKLYSIMDDVFFQQTDAFKKVSKTPVDEGVNDPNKKYRVNVMNYYGAEEVPTSEEEDEMLFKYTQRAMDRFIKNAKKSQWDARRMFSDRIITLNFHVYSSPLTKLLTDKGYNVCEMKFGRYDFDFSLAKKAAEYGVDAFLYPKKFRVEMSLNMWGDATIDESEIPDLPYFFNPEKEDKEVIAEKIIEQFHKNRKSFS